ncbi:MAG: SCP2 sterol-binding domain-containing protein [Pseudomonadota bacterium]
MNKDPTIDQIIEGMPSRFQPKAAKGLDAILQFRLSGETGTDFFATIAEDKCVLERGIHTSPTLTMRMSDQTYIDMVMGRITGQQAFFLRKLTYKGPIALAIRLHKFFKAPDLAD